MRLIMLLMKAGHSRRGTDTLPRGGPRPLPKLPALGLLLGRTAHRSAATPALPALPPDPRPPAARRVRAPPVQPGSRPRVRAPRPEAEASLGQALLAPPKPCPVIRCGASHL